jgi:hypothetical protein
MEVRIDMNRTVFLCVLPFTQKKIHFTKHERSGKGAFFIFRMLRESAPLPPW